METQQLGGFEWIRLLCLLNLYRNTNNYPPDALGTGTGWWGALAGLDEDDRVGQYEGEEGHHEGLRDAEQTVGAHATAGGQCVQHNQAGAVASITGHQAGTVLVTVNVLLVRLANIRRLLEGVRRHQAQ